MIKQNGLQFLLLTRVQHNGDLVGSTGLLVPNFIWSSLCLILFLDGALMHDLQMMGLESDFAH